MDGPRKLTVKLKGEVRDKWQDKEGVYSLSPNLLNGKSIWLQESGSNALWYDKWYDNWKIGFVYSLGGSNCSLKSDTNTEGNPPHKVAPWKYMKNDKWTDTKDIIVEEDTSNTLGIF